MRTPRPALPHATAVAAGMAICLSVALVTATGAAADAPLVYGWWSQTSLGASGPAPPDVPADGLFVQNLPSGPVAVSALEFRLPSQGPSRTSITLQITGEPIITQPPLVCAATSQFEPAHNAAWSGRPTYDCSHAVMGVVDAAQTRVQFAVDPLVRGSTLSLVVLASGPVDRIPLKRPDFGTLTQVPSDTGAPVDTGAPPPTTPAQPPPVSPALVPEPAVPSAALVQITSTTQATQDVRRAAPVAATPPPARKKGHAALGTIILVLVVLCIVYWSDGFGVLTLRSSRRERQTA